MMALVLEETYDANAVAQMLKFDESMSTILGTADACKVAKYGEEQT
jgi:hypothetical protein